MALIFAARQSSPGSSTVVFTVSLSVRFAANTSSSVTSHTAQRQDTKTVNRVHTFTSTLLHMQAEKRFYGFTGDEGLGTWDLGLGTTYLLVFSTIQDR